MNPQELEELLRELVQAVTQVMESGEILSDEFQGMIAQTLNNLFTRIDELNQNEASNQIPPGPLEPSVSNDAQLLWILSGQQPQAFISYLRNFPTQQTTSLLNNPTELNRTIEELTRMMPQGQQPVIDGIQHADLNSSNIWGASYDPKSGKMKVRFQGGSEYEYDGVPKAIFDAFIHGNAEARTNGQNQYGRWWRGKNPSLGAAMNQYIKAGNFNYRRLN